MKKKFKLTNVIGAFLLVMMLVVVVGCSDDADTTADTNGDTVTEPNEDVTNDTDENGDTDISGSITVWSHMFSAEPILEEIVEAFNVLYPNVDVEIVIQGGGDAAVYYTQLSTAIQAGSAPDLFWTNGTPTPHMGDFVDNDVLLDLTDIIDVSDLNEDALTLGTIDGRLYSIPWMVVDTRAVYYNIDMFEENGWEVPQTFDEFEALLGKQLEAGYIPISLSPSNPWSLLFAYEPILAAMYPDFMRGLADYSVLATDDPARSALNRMVDWGDRGYFGRNFLGVMSNDEQLLAFTFGNAAMMIGGSWETQGLQDNNPNLNLGAFQIPSNNGTRGMVGTFSNGFSIYQNSRNLDAAIAFQQFLASNEAQTIWVHGNQAVSGSRYIEAATDIVQQISDAEYVFTSWHFILSEFAVESGAAVTIWDQDFPRIFSGDVTVDEMMDAIAEVMQ